LAVPKLSSSMSSLANLILSICSENTTKDLYVNKPRRLEWPLAFLKHWYVEPASCEPLQTAFSLHVDTWQLPSVITIISFFVLACQSQQL
jgi:hypothetical protein